LNQSERGAVTRFQLQKQKQWQLKEIITAAAIASAIDKDPLIIVRGSDNSIKSKT
jgi:hypothetical protein